MTAWRLGVAGLALVSAGVANGQTTSSTPGQPSAQAAAAQAERARLRRERGARRLRNIAAAERVMRRWTAQELVQFRDEADFDAYLDAVRAREEAEYAAANARRVQFAQVIGGEQSDAVQDVCPPEDKNCRVLRERASNDEGNIVVTGSAVVPPPLTNNQEHGVDEGDVVKQIGQYLLVLQDGRIFVIDTEAGARRDELRLTDRADVYRNAEDDAWYDELVVEGDRVLVTGYAYEANASELAIFRLGENGRLTREGVFQIKSEDYYSRNNYASRLIGDELILYTPIPVEARERGSFRWPTLLRADMQGFDPNPPSGTRLLRPEQLYRPLATLANPVIHLITRCRLGDYRPGADLACASQGFVAARANQYYVAEQSAYLWSGAPWDWDPNRPFCDPGYRPPRQDADRSIIHRISLSGGDIGVVGATGMPLDQLGMDAGNGRFRALIAWQTERCNIGKDMPLHYFEIADSAFARRLRPAPDSAFTPLPDIEANVVENRFTERHLIVGGRVLPVDGSSYHDEEDEEVRSVIGAGDALVVPLDRPGNARRVALPHRVWRVERIGENAVLTGYADDRGLQLSVLDLRAETPRLADTAQLGGRAETEGRSHAFNSLIDADGSGFLGLPTVARAGPLARYSSRSTASDLSFLAIDGQGALHPLGALETRANEDRGYFDEDASDNPAIYTCQVSCIDWYGNSRALFTRGRVFALTGTELVEGRVASGRIGEVQRIDLTKELPAHLQPARAAAADESVPTKH